jgi:hypothetical protein
VVGVEWGFDTENLRRAAPNALISRPSDLLKLV